MKKSQQISFELNEPVVYAYRQRNFFQLDGTNSKGNTTVLKNHSNYITKHKYAAIFSTFVVDARSFVRINVNLMIVMNFHKKMLQCMLKMSMQ